MKKDNETQQVPALGCAIALISQRLISQLGEALADAGLNITAAEYIVMRALYTANGAQQCEIAAMVGKDKASVCRTVNSLRAKGYLSTTPVSHKCRTVHLTPAAFSIKDQIANVAGERHSALADILSPDEFKSFSSIVNKIVKHI